MDFILARNFKAPVGQSIFSPGQECPGFLSLKSGSIRVTLSGASGREVVLYRVGPGEVCLQTFSCLVDGRVYGAEGIVEADIEGEMIPAREFRKRLEDDKDFRQAVLASVALRFTEYQELVEDVALTAFDARLAKTLLKLADDEGLVRSSHASLAAETASGRAYVSRRLAAFARQGLVEQRTHGVCIIDKRTLEQIVADSR
ncbi:Crp/Fnr family transcriptional regulator [Sedimentitalea sp. HM32M-2]|uniref:Crp/Fnr family transcriptional regulator n=1 Tax=Sedimentitalea sp. HM32M-2 TaxID=3351566 RepID=UPI00362BE308